MKGESKAEWWTCQCCVEEGEWDEWECFTPDMCRYIPEIHLIEGGHLSPNRVLFGKWNPEYILENGDSIKFHNKKRVKRCYNEVKRRYPKKVKSGGRNI